MRSEGVARHYPGRDLEAMSFALNYHRWIVAQFVPYLGDTIAEVGAGSGSVSKLLLQQNVKQLFAFEPSDNMFRVLANELKQETRAKAINDFFHPRHGKQRFDAVAYINVLEHIEDDRIELANAFEALRTNGHLLLFVPALAWLYSEHDKEIGHFRRYTKSGLASLVEQAGFTIVKARYFDVVGILPWYVNFVLLRNSIGGRSVALYDRLVVPLMRNIETAIPPPIGKNVLLVGRKR
jgi:SAM-dependent methyltransferase